MVRKTSRNIVETCNAENKKPKEAIVYTAKKTPVRKGEKKKKKKKNRPSKSQWN
jgi:hypothetical protein